MTEVTGRKGLSVSALKTVAVCAMTCDHIACFAMTADSVWYFALRAFGRLTAPLMCFALTEGLVHTSSRRNYLLRLGVFAVISQFAYSFAFYSTAFYIYDINVMASLVLAFLSCVIYDTKWSPLKKTAAVGALAVLSLRCDWGLFMLLLSLIFHIFRENRKALCICSVAVFSVYAGANILPALFLREPALGSLWHLGTVAAICPVMLYDGRRGRGGAALRLLPYFYYPAHLIILALIFG